MTKRTVSVVMLGASGAVGGIAACELMNLRSDVARLTLLNRRKLDGFDDPRVVQHVVDVTDESSYESMLAGHDCAICCLGVGQPSKVSKEEFVRIDKTAALAFASACKRAGVSHFELLASVGADAKSSSFYLRTKGELQEGIAALGFARTSFFQPSMILTPNNRYGFSQGVLLATWPAISTLLVGSLKKYRGIEVETLGCALAQNALTQGAGVEKLQWEQIRRMVSR